jgi:UDP-N-acetylmuramyl pentapeptide synthase
LEGFERLGSRDNIAAAKAELLEALPDSGYAILNADDDYYEFLKSKFSGKKLNFGYSEDAEVRATNVRVDSSGCPAFSVVTPLGNFDVQLDVIGEHNVINALAAVIAGILFEVPLCDIASALVGYVPPEKRANVVTTKSGITVLDDTYNASPASVTSALKTLQVMEGARKIAVLGDMLELGDHAISAHAEVGRTAAECGVDRLVTVGPLSRSTMDGAVSAGMKQDLVDSFDTSEQVGAQIRSELRAGDVVLVKGSRGMKMEKIVEVLIGD